MTTSQQAQSPSDIDKSSQEEYLPLFAKFRLRDFNKRVKYSAGVIMDNHLVVLAQDDSIHRSNLDYDNFYDGYDSKKDEPATLLAFNLQDHTVQEVKLGSEPFGYQEGYYHFLRYGENQIIKYGGDFRSNASSMICITIESFELGKAFKVEYERMNDQSRGVLSFQTAQIYEDYMYVYAKAKDLGTLWSFDLSMGGYYRRKRFILIENQTWKLCEMTGEAPPKLTKTPKSFIFEDNLYVYDGWKHKSLFGDIFMLNLNSMKWTKIQQEENEKDDKEEKEVSEEEDQDRDNCKKWSGAVYKDHLVFMATKMDPEDDEESFLGLLSLRKNEWLSWNFKGLGKPGSYLYAITGGLMSYKNWILKLATEGHDSHLIVTMMNIEDYGDCLPPKSGEDEDQSDLFLSENESDVAFKIDEKVIPAHKEILMNKSKYFAGLFNSNMVESKQDIIEIKDCEYEVFKGLLQWIYQFKLDLKEANQAISLYFLADKYLQTGLPEKCLDILVSMIDMDDVITILEFALQENNLYLKSWCLKCIQDKLTLQNVAGFIKDLEKLKEKNEKFRDQAFLFILDNFFELYENAKGEMQIYEEFIIKNIEMSTVAALAHFLGRNPKKQRKIFERQCDYQYEGEDESEEEVRRRKGVIRRDHFEKCTVNLKEAVFRFVQENDELVMKGKMWKDFPGEFMRDLFLHTNKKNGNRKKRMEPGQNAFDGEEEIHELKKTKKSDPAFN